MNFELADARFREEQETIPDQKRTTASGRNLFSNFSSKNLQRNNNYTNRLVKSYSRGLTKTQSSQDIKFRDGEGMRSMKLAARS
mmetsp:Transcript_41304/g.36652  ORF Transcript_41304/g.36652 Transcript_41304/m.36652 type:complete len:84 (+) Transcript_41304:516-767(+)